MGELELDYSGSRQKKIWWAFVSTGTNFGFHMENALTSCGEAQEGLRSMKFVISGWN